MKLYDKSILPLENKFTKQIKKILDNQAELIEKRCKEHFKEKKDNDKISKEEAEKRANEIVEKVFNENDNVKAIYKELLATYILSGKLGAETFEKIYLNQNGKIYNIIKDDFLKWLESYGCDRIVMVNRTTKDITRRIIKEGLEKGNSTQSIVNSLSTRIKEYNKNRAKKIAETEMHNTYMFSNNLSATKSGFKYKKWITSKDSAVRPSHRTLDDKVVKMDEEFAPGLAFPGDWRASAKETIRCRCICRYMIKKE